MWNFSVQHVFKHILFHQYPFCASFLGWNTLSGYFKRSLHFMAYCEDRYIRKKKWLFAQLSKIWNILLLIRQTARSFGVGSWYDLRLIRATLKKSYRSSVFFLTKLDVWLNPIRNGIPKTWASLFPLLLSSLWYDDGYRWRGIGLSFQHQIAF